MPRTAQARKGQQDRAEETSPGKHRLWHPPPAALGWWGVSESPWDAVKSAVLLGHTRIRSLESSLHVTTRTRRSQLQAHTQHQCQDSVHQAPYLHPPTPHPSTRLFLCRKLICRCLWNMFIYERFFFFLIWEINLSPEGTSHLHRRAQSHKENPIGDQKRSLMLEGSLH